MNLVSAKFKDLGFSKNNIDENISDNWSFIKSKLIKAISKKKLKNWGGIKNVIR